MTLQSVDRMDHMDHILVLPVYNKYVRRGHRPDEWDNVRLIRNDTSKMITIAKDNSFASLGQRLSNHAIGIKTYWSTLNKIINKKKATNIPPLLENGLFVTNFQNKAEIFNNYFVQQCSLNMNDSILPRSYITRCNNLNAITFWKPLKSMPTKF